MAKEKEEFFTPERCLNCLGKCKKEMNVIFKDGFENGRNKILCGKQVKTKKGNKLEAN